MRLASGLLSLVLLLACSSTEANDSGALPAVATTGMIADIVKNVGGEHVSVVALMGPGVDPHLYKAREGDVRRLWRSRIIFYNGLHLEARMAEVLAHMDERTPTVAVAQAVDSTQLLAPPGFSGAYDPHIWFDVRFWMDATEAVRDGLTAVDPAHAEDYARNADAYVERLEELHAYVLRRAAEVPPERRVLVTAHDAFNYFGRAYGFEVRGLQGISTASEAGTADVQALADLIVQRRIPAIFVESSIPQRTIEAVRAAVQARGFEVRIGGQLYSDAMGSPGTPEGTYIGMVRHNIDTIVDALLRDPEETT
ncbi:MAG TPA: zinc ABC transporter substrate-binding protein [Longimicrobiaceae bacterium]